MQKLSLLFAITLFSAASFAQIQRVTSKTKPITDSVSKTATISPEENAGRQMNKKQLMRELNLTKEQKGKLKEIHQANKAKKDEITSDENLSETEKQVKLKELQKQQAKSTQNILNNEQKEKMKKLRSEKIKKNKANKKNTEAAVTDN